MVAEWANESILIHVGLLRRPGFNPAWESLLIMTMTKHDHEITNIPIVFILHITWAYNVMQ